MEARNTKLRPRARTEGLVVRELSDEVLIYDLERHRALCLNRTAALVWKRCDGQTSVAALRRALGSELGGAVAEEVVWLALESLGRDNLLDERVRRPAELTRLSRRELMKKIGLAAAVSLPVVTAIVAPTAADAASCLPTGAACGSPAECCSGLCPAGTCT